ncbi:N-acetylmuramoyl-L-alanine amidase [Selenomonas sp. oral taxon 126]|uniref:peptidoglycan recognition protein family protein n=1 Tax=Selenomonas sp. oral taxon 126 TaxID=712528 RepID=UPI000807A09E|nr:peptidoglycan recognition family protein [Selenomonas sp. oral taxon 126]ANR70660.1 N-acetylmuramoyl-L-alanine amidase [Selenomonas sp. oral taxon 126]
MERVPVVDTYLDIDYDNLRTRGVTDKIVIHHTGNAVDDDLSAAEIDASHKGQGWTCIGYHYVIRKDGTVEQGRPHWTVGAHAYRHNSYTIGIHVCGNFEIGEPTDAQIESAAMLLANICTDYGLPIDRDHIVGHRELMSTACPGEYLYEMLDTIVGKANFYAAQ